MNTKTKWLLWFALLGLYAMSLGGVFFYNLFKWTFEEKLKQDVIGAVRTHTAVLHAGLLNSPSAITFPEYDVVTALSNDPRIASLVYLTRSARIRWHKEGRFIGRPLGELMAQVPFATDALGQAYRSRALVVRAVRGEPFSEIAIPLTLRGEITGVFLITLSHVSSDLLVWSALRKYVLGAAAVLILLGLPLYFFLTHYVFSRIDALRDAVRGSPVRNPQLRFPAGSDEIGGLAGDISELLSKIRADLEGRTELERQYREGEAAWWKSLLRVMAAPGSMVLVVDEDNNMLYSDLDLPAVQGTKKVHLLDIVGESNQGLLRLVGESYERPSEVISGETVFRGAGVQVKVMHVGTIPEIGRTLIMFLPVSGG